MLLQRLADEDSIGFGDFRSLFIFGRKAFLAGGSGRHSVAGVDGGEVDTACIDCPFKKYGMGGSERNRNLEKPKVSKGNCNCI